MGSSPKESTAGSIQLLNARALQEYETQRRVANVRRVGDLRSHRRAGQWFESTHHPNQIVSVGGPRSRSIHRYFLMSVIWLASICHWPCRFIQTFM